MRNFIYAAVLVGLLLALPAQAQFAFKDVSGASLELTENGKPVFLYHYGGILKSGFPETMRRCCYLDPVYLPDGTVITDDFNKDHPHHRGISWMWPVVVVDGKTYDVWTMGGMRAKFGRWISRDAGAKSATLAVENGWYIGDRKVVKENVEIRVHPAKDGVRYLDFILRFEPTGEPVEIAGTPDQKKGFGGFCFRFAPRDGGQAKTIIRSDQGVAKKDGVNEPHPWAQVEGTFNGKPGGGRIDDDPSNPGFPKNGWLMRHGFGFLNVSYPGLEHLKLEAGKPLVLKYRVTLFNGESPKQ